MRKHRVKMLYLALFAILISSINCDQDPASQPVEVSMTVGSSSSSGFSVQALPSGFICYVVAVRESTDSDSSHCFDSNTSEEIPVTTLFGPFQANDQATFTLSAGGTTTFNLIASSNSTLCSTTTQADLSPIIFDSGNARLVTNSSANIVGGTNNLSLIITSSTGNVVSNCSSNPAVGNFNP